MENNLTYYLALDISSDTTLGELDDILKKFNMTISNYLPFGPGGGNPEITFATDDLKNFKDFLFDAYGADGENDFDFYLSSVVVK